MIFRLDMCKSRCYCFLCFQLCVHVRIIRFAGEIVFVEWASGREAICFEVALTPRNFSVFMFCVWLESALSLSVVFQCAWVGIADPLLLPFYRSVGIADRFRLSQCPYQHRLTKKGLLC